MKELEKLTDDDRATLDAFVKKQWEGRGPDKFSCGDVAADATVKGLIPGKTICFAHVMHAVKRLGFTSGAKNPLVQKHRKFRKKAMSEKKIAGGEKPQVTDVVELAPDAELAIISEIITRVNVLSEAGRQYLSSRIVKVA